MREDAVAFYLARYGELMNPIPGGPVRCAPQFSEAAFPRGLLSHIMGVEPAILNMRVKLFQKLLKNENVESVSISATVVFKKLFSCPQTKHRAMVDFIMLRGPGVRK
jgi:hypothetical protein